MVSWLAFTATFTTVRVITHKIKGANGEGRLHNVSVGGVHLHHYMWGILTVSTVGGVAIRGEERTRRHPLVATAYGVGLALIVDEFALLLDLQDVYWAKQGRKSVDLAVGIISTSGSSAGGPAGPATASPQPQALTTSSREVAVRRTSGGSLR